MAYTNFIGDGVSVNGAPLLPGMGGIPFTGRWIFCDYANGSDGNEGTVDSPVQTITRAHQLATAGNNDVVVIVGDGTTTATQRLEETFVWSKDATHLVGMTAPSMYAQRARISTLTTATVNINPLMTISADGCGFANFSFFQGVGEAGTEEQLLQITGQRNYFGALQFGGMGAQAGADDAASYCVYLNGAGENYFERCAIGLETVQRGAANASVLVRNGAQRNDFSDCVFQAAADATTMLFIDANASNALNGSSMAFTRCSFRNLLNVTGATGIDQTAAVHNSVNGTIFFDACSTMADEWSDNTSGVVYTNCAVPNGDTGGIFVVPTA